MKDSNKIVNPDEARILLGKYFDATISPMEMARLDSIANDAESGKLMCHDNEISDNLHFISTFSKFAGTSLSSIADNMPAGLEERMNSHISMLAAKAQSRKRISSFAKIVSFTSAAAVAALIAFAGYNYLSREKDILPTPQILIADASISDSVTHTTESTPSISENAPTLNVTAGITAMSTPNRKSHHTAAKRPIKIQQPTTDNQPLTTDNQQTFSISEETFKVMPSGILASVDPAQILLQPITTLSQSINNIYESVESVSEALSGVSSSLRAVSNSLALLTEPI